MINKKGFISLPILIGILVLGGVVGSYYYLSDNSASGETVDLNAEPIIPKGDTFVESHRKMGKVKIERRGDDLYIGGKRVVLYLTDDQAKPRDLFSPGSDLQAQLVDKPVLNATVVDYLLTHKELIPESWKKTGVLFWGTIFRLDVGMVQPARSIYMLYFGGENAGKGGDWFQPGWNKIGVNLPTTGGRTKAPAAIIED